MTKNLKNDLQIFNPEYVDSVDSIYDFLENLYEIYSLNITKIYKRFDLHMAIDLAIHSVQSYNLGNEFILKGWGDVMILGDTRCGKGFVTERLLNYYDVGEIVSGENVTIAGLVGGVQQIGGKWILQWGKIPINDRRLVVVDEFGEIKDIFPKLSRVRSEGIVEITKIRTETSYARTRLIFLANPIKNRTISSYSHGIEALTDIIENAEDISRFDYVLIVANNEVSLEDINTFYSEKSNPYEPYDKQLVRWIWTRKPNQIRFSEDTLKALIRYSIKLGNLYSPAIPLIQGENIRVKLSKIGTMIAGRLFSASKDGESIVVHPSHIEAAYVFLNMIYKKSCSSYQYYSSIRKEMSEMKEPDLLKRYIQSFNNWQLIIDYLIGTNYITANDMSEHINQPREIVREIISVLLKHCCIQKKYTFYVKNQEFTDWLKSMK
jgi:hypothetical protein